MATSGASGWQAACQIFVPAILANFFRRTATPRGSSGRLSRAGRTYFMLAAKQGNSGTRGSASAKRGSYRPQAAKVPTSN